MSISAPHASMVMAEVHLSALLCFTRMMRVAISVIRITEMQWEP